MKLTEPFEAQKHQAIETHSRQASEFAQSYQELGDDVFQSCFTYSRHRLEHWLDEYLPSQGNGLSLLDVGCGTGHHMAKLRQRGFVVSGVDGSVAMLAQARANNPEADVRLGDVESLPYASESFDIVVCIEVLRYLPKMAPSLREMARVLKPGGMCLVTAAPLLSFNGYALVNRAATLVPMGDLVRLRQFFTTSRELRREFRRAGFAVPKVHGVYCGPLNWVEHLAPNALPQFLERWMRLDEQLADHPLSREFSNMFLVRALRRDKNHHQGCSSETITNGV